MSGDLVHPALVEAALVRVAGTAFEDFVNEFYPSIAGAEYVPLGGTGDGGADGFLGWGVAQDTRRAGHFLQASVQKEFKSKIRDTVKRLKEFGRKPVSLTYVTSVVIPHLDTQEEDVIGEPLGVAVLEVDGESGVDRPDFVLAALTNPARHAATTAS